MSKPAQCPVCRARGPQFRLFDNVRAWSELTGVYECKICGHFGMEDSAARLLARAEYADRGYRVSAVLREASLRDAPALVTDDASRLTVGGYTPLSVQEILTSRFPRTISEILDRIILNLSRMSKYPGFELNIEYETQRAVFFARNSEEAAFYAKALMGVGWLDWGLRDEPDREAFIGSVSPKGLLRVAELQAGRVGEPLTQAFVAMWFGSDRVRIGDCLSAEFCTKAFLSGFKPAINNAGYSERRIDFKEFNDDVMDEIIAEIRRSKFVVADFTGHRAGVYYEAGFARGLGIPVIFTCHKDQVESAHFDTSHMNHLTWGSFDELAKKLEKRIVATIGQGPLAAQHTQA
jgi:nucleoside 2-deoxyribosyltransferase